MREEIERLAQEKDFASLNEREREVVLAEMTSTDFEHLRQLLLSARQLDLAVMPPPALRERLLAEMAVQAKPSPWLRRVAMTQIPLGYAAAALLLGVALGGLWKKESVVEKLVPELRVRVDTVFQEKVRWRERVIYREKKTVAPMALVPARLDAPTIDAALLSPPPVGTSLGDVPELLEFFTQGDQ